MNVKVWAEKITIPTYEVGTPDKNPMFFENRVYQGSSGVVYPNPVIEKIYDDKIDKEYTGLFLENKYLKIMILPELGGRVQMAYDKIKQRHFIYYNRVIKPALVGLCGPWISGGIEFNWPQHHRPSTYEPLEYTTEENEDGSATIWVNEIEKMFHTRAMVGFTLYPGKAYMEIKAKLSNPTSIPQTFLWWANPAVSVHNDYQSVFPPDVNAVFDHGKRDVSSFPIATGTYYKVDYSPGTDISNYKNIPVPTSYMAINSKYDFLGGYEHNIEAGMLHIADHHVSPGKKQWTWGNGDFGAAWDRNLTDEDGPYIELMAGVFTDNQPDFTWLKPFEEKTFTQYFLPYRELGMVKNASKDVLISFDLNGNEAYLKVFVTSDQHISIKLFKGENVYFETAESLRPEVVFKKKVLFAEPVQPEDLHVSVFDSKGMEILRYSPLQDKHSDPLPEAAKPAPQPQEVENEEQLFLIGQHLEQYRHATYRPMPYYLEALKRNPKDIRNNNAVGSWYFKKGLFKESIRYFQEAINTITGRNPNPYNCEPYYNMGLALLFMDNNDAAYDAFFKSAWDKSFQDVGMYFIALIDFKRSHYERCIEHINWSLDGNARNGKAYVLKAAALMASSKSSEAVDVLNIALEKDLFNLAAYYELYLIWSSMQNDQNAGPALKKMLELGASKAHNAIEYAIDYLQSGQYIKAVEFIRLMAAKELETDPLTNYYLAYAFLKMEKNNEAWPFLQKAANMDSAHCFPNRLYDILVLQIAADKNPEDAKALYYLGNLFYDKQQYEKAIGLWEKSSALDASFPTVFRNLGLAYFNKTRQQNKALECYEKAFSMNTADARMLMELNALYKRLNKSPEFRLEFLQRHSFTAEKRDDLYLEIAALHNFIGDHQLAYDMLMSRKFHPWEGGEGKVSEQYVLALTALAKKAFKEGDFRKALTHLENAQSYPHNLGEGKLPGAQENDIHYWMGCCYNSLGDDGTAISFWEKATEGANEPGMAIYYNDQQPDKIFYQACAWSKLGDNDMAESIFKKLINYGEKHIRDSVSLDYFAVSLPDLLIFESDIQLKNKIHCKYITALGYLGLENYAAAEELFQEILSAEAMHFGAKFHRRVQAISSDTRTNSFI